ncbi:phasin [Dichotomicrobium thermohalophilum]|uniref:Phasin n=1 Tax=Dichotomicrobium thermohalophilum TaxID=933063 RepID=A0A397Q1R6_9HYPH|nr:phasin [Dichotomicrobium thermohalophilum]RIA55440.1 phasin [Dichotomicrobium thermohalophilum]
MNDATNFDIPAPVRQMAEKSVEQTKQAYDRLLEAARQAQGMFADSTNAMGMGSKEIQEKTMQYAEANVQASFDLAERLVKAKDLQEVMEIQTQFARQQMESYTQQAQEISKMMAEAAQKAQPKA